jgi:hypothetical protein
MKNAAFSTQGAQRGPRPSPSAEGGGLVRALGHSVLMIALLAGVGGALIRDALAQEGPSSGLDSQGERSVDLSPPGASTEPSASSLSPQERVSRGKAFVATIERASQSILRQLQTARKDRDVVRVLCLSDKLNQVDVASRSAQDRYVALKAGAERSDADRARHEYTVLEVLNDRVRVLVNESNQCVGEETGFVGEAEVSVSIDPNLPEPDTGFAFDAYALPPLPNISSPIE